MTSAARVSINAGLDAILGGGLPVDRLYLVEGDPGTGKTTLALQFLLDGVRRGETALYVTLSETTDELQAVADSHGWSLDGITIHELTPNDMLSPDAQYTVFHPSEVELTDTMNVVFQTLDRVRPRRAVFDSLSEMRLLARDPLRYRRADPRDQAVLHRAAVHRAAPRRPDGGGRRRSAAAEPRARCDQARAAVSGVRRLASAPSGDEAPRRRNPWGIPRLRDQARRPRGLSATGRRD